jgi:hypothetical protein
VHQYLLPACRLIVLTRRWRRLRRQLPHRFGHRCRQMGAYGRGCPTAMEPNCVWRRSSLRSVRPVHGQSSRLLYLRTRVQISNLDDEAKGATSVSGFGLCTTPSYLGGHARDLATPMFNVGYFPQNTPPCQFESSLCGRDSLSGRMLDFPY